MPTTATTASDREVRRAFRRIVREDRRRVVTGRWRSLPPAFGDARITTHDDRRSPIVSGGVIATVLLAAVGAIWRDSGLLLVAAAAGLPLAFGVACHRARTHVTVTADGRVAVGNGIHRRIHVAPALAVAHVGVHEPARWSRWRVDRPFGVVVLRGGAVLRCRALAYDPSVRGDRDRAEALARRIETAARDAGAVLESARRTRA